MPYTGAPGHAYTSWWWSAHHFAFEALCGGREPAKPPTTWTVENLGGGSDGHPRTFTFDTKAQARDFVSHALDDGHGDWRDLTNQTGSVPSSRSLAPPKHQRTQGLPDRGDPARR